MKVLRALVLLLSAAALFMSCSDATGPTATSPLPQNEPSFAKTGLPSFARDGAPSLQLDDEKDEDFNCTNVQKTRVRFGHPGWVSGTNVGLFAEFVGMPGDGSKIIRVWWDFEGSPDVFEDLDISQSVRAGENGLFDWDGILEHSYNVGTTTGFRVRIELIIPGQTGNCARVRDVNVEPIRGGGGGVAGAGTFLFASGSRDEYRFTGTPGATVTITVDTTVAATAFDPAYILFSDPGESGLLVVQDDDFGCTFPPPAFSCPTSTFALPADADGQYYLVVYALGSRADPARGDYRATVTGAGSPRLVTNDF